MRVIAGQYRGRTLHTVRDLSVRPATDRVKQTLFDMLANRLQLEGADVLDLFAGSGALGIEAISRGAARATFVEHQDDAVLFLEQNLRTLGCEGSGAIYEMDAMTFLRTHRESYDLVFADPPYEFGQTQEIPPTVFDGGFVRPGGYLLIEHQQGLTFTDGDGYTAGPRKKFGRTVVTFFTRSTHSA